MIGIGYAVKAILISYLVFLFVREQQLSYLPMAVLLLFLALSILKEKFADHVYTTIALLALVCAAAAVDVRFSLLFAAVGYHFVLERGYVGAGVAAAGLIYVSRSDSMLLLYLVVFGLSVMLAYAMARRKDELSRHTAALDNERRLRYELERAKAELLHSSKSIAEIAEVKERNRIARDIHDGIGHALAGVLIQLQAAFKLHDVDSGKSMEIVRQSIERLADSADVLRRTVHNIKPAEEVGTDYFRKIAEGYPYCPVELKLSGDFNDVPAEHLEVIGTNMKEALTNTARYSEATAVEIAIEANMRYTRLYVKDNGKGCANVREGLGISGMKERVRNMGGSVSVSGDNGFMIVCFIPRQEGSGTLESVNHG